MSTRNRQSSYQFSAQEQLELYLARRDELIETRLMRNGYKPSFSMKWDHLAGMSIGCSQPDEDDLRSFLTIFRKFISQESPIYIYKIFNLCQQHIMDDNIKHDLAEARRGWGNQLKYGFMKLTFNGKDLAPEFLNDLWINAVYFHDDL